MLPSHAVRHLLSDLPSTPHPPRYTEAQAGLVEFVFIGSGMAGLLSAGPAMDATRRYATLMRVCVWAAAASALALVPVMAASNLLPLLLVCGTLGFVLTAVQAVALETAAQISYPVGESTSSGIVFGLAVAVYCCLPFLVDRVALRTVLSCQVVVCALIPPDTLPYSVMRLLLDC